MISQAGSYCLEFLARSSLVKRPLRRPRKRWKDNIKMELSEIGLEDGGQMKLIKDCAKWRY
jgi:hypothetical protein